MTGKSARPVPRPGDVIRYAYLWRDEAIRGREEGAKDRPCAVVLAAERVGERTTVLVAPITHSPPADPADALELPVETKRRLSLDDARSWIVATELNAFTWPGSDVRLIRPGDRNSGFVYGVLPAKLTRKLLERILTGVREGRAKMIDRD